MDKIFLLNYLFYIFLSGGIVLLIFAIMAFCSVDNFEIPYEKSNSAGTIVLISSILYFGLSGFVYWRVIKEEEERTKRLMEERLMQSIDDKLYESKHNINYAGSSGSKSEEEEEEEDKKEEFSYLIDSK